MKLNNKFLLLCFAFLLSLLFFSSSSFFVSAVELPVDLSTLTLEAAPKGSSVIVRIKTVDGLISPEIQAYRGKKRDDSIIILSKDQVSAGVAFPQRKSRTPTPSSTPVITHDYDSLSAIATPATTLFAVLISFLLYLQAPSKTAITTMAIVLAAVAVLTQMHSSLAEPQIEIVILLPSGWLIEEPVGDSFVHRREITLHILKPSQSSSTSPSPSESPTPSVSESTTPSTSPSATPSLSITPSFTLELCGCPEGKRCVKGTCVGVGIISVTAIWTIEGDGDLQVNTPNDYFINYSNRKENATGGFLDVDDQEGTGPENIYWPVGTTPSAGTYHVCFNAYDYAVIGDTYTIVIKIVGKPDKLITGIAVQAFNAETPCTPSSEVYVTSFTYP